MLWELHGSDFRIRLKVNIWQSVSRLGQIAGNRNSFMGLIISYNSIIGYKVNGAPHLWKRLDADDDWQSIPAFTGHFAPVKDLD